MSESISESNITEDLINNCLSDDSMLNVFDFIPILQLFKSRLVCKRFKQLIDYKLKIRSSIAVTIKSDDIDEEYDSRHDCCDDRHRFTTNDCIYKSCRPIKDGSRTLYVLSEKHLNPLFTFCPNIRALSLEYTIFDRNVWQYFRDKCPKGVQHLDLSNSQGLIDEVIRFIAISCGQTLKHILLNDSDISESTLKFLLENCPKLEILDISHNIRINGLCFQLMSKSITSLAINQCWNIGFHGIQSLVRGCAQSLRRLEIDGEFVDNKMLEQICDHLLDLTYLETDCSDIKDKKVLRKISNLRHLEELSLCLPSINFDLIFIDIIRNCPKMKKIFFDGAILTDYSIKYLPQFCPNLESLSISSGEVVVNEKITDESCESLSSLKNLIQLDLKYTRIGDKLIRVITDCPNIHTIEIDGSKRVTNKLIECLIETANRRTTESLTLFGRETNLKEPEIELPINLTLILH